MHALDQTQSVHRSRSIGRPPGRHDRQPRRVIGRPLDAVDLPAGLHVVHVLAEGQETVEWSVTFGHGEVTIPDLSLQALSDAGDEVFAPQEAASLTRLAPSIREESRRSPPRWTPTCSKTKGE